MPATRLTGKVVVITGASSGVGRAASRAFAREGARLGLIARGEDALAATAREVGDLGGEAMVLPLDVSKPGAVDAAAAQLIHRWGAIDLWINNAMVSVFAPVEETTAAEFRRVLEVNFLGTVHGTLAALRYMRSAGQGAIIQIGSALAYRSIPLQSAYCASKAAIRGFTDSLRSELIHQRSEIKLSMLQLPAVNTPQFDVVRNKLGEHAHPVPPIYQPETIADAIVDAAFHPRREIWIGWPALKAILGQKVMPGFLDHFLARTAWGSQLSPKLPPTRRDNLDAPLPGDRGAHGAFDDEARSFSLALWATTHRKAVAATLMAAGAVALVGWLGRR
jgi:short-subunit dehydrogenase